MNTTTATASQVHLTSPQRGKYGRTEVFAYFGKHVYDGATQAVMVTLPKVYREETGNAYLVNIWAAERNTAGHTPVFYARTRKEALAILHREVLALHN